MNSILTTVFIVFAGLNIYCAFAEDLSDDSVVLERVKRQATPPADMTPTQLLRNTLNVYTFTSTDYPAIFAIIAGMSTILAIAVLFIGVGIWNMDPGKDSIIYRMTTTRMKKD